MLTKEQCNEALKVIISRGGGVEELLYWTYAMPDAINTLNNLIDEHFDNPPLTFGELKVGMWVWDNKDKYYFKCNPRISTDMAECVWYESFWYNTGEGYDEFYEDYIEFEPNRFYRKEVQDV